MNASPLICVHESAPQVDALSEDADRNMKYFPEERRIKKGPSGQLDVKVVPLGWIIGQKRNKLCKKGTSQREREQVKRTKLTIQVQYKYNTRWSEKD